MEYCKRCLFPANAKPKIDFDEKGICQSCRSHELIHKVDWGERESRLKEILSWARQEAKKRGNKYDCVIPVSGGKDSHFQVWTIRKKYGLNPLLVAFDHVFNSAAGLRNLANLVEKSGCDLIRFSINHQSAKKLAKYMLKKVGDLTWCYHAGIMTIPIQVAVRFNIPLVVWGEYATFTGSVEIDESRMSMEAFKQRTQKVFMRGVDINSVLDDSYARSLGITIQDFAPYFYPSDEEIDKVDVRVIYLGMFIPWDAKGQVEFVMREWDFKPVTYYRDRTFNLYAKTDDHANDIHDYLKFLKFGYGRATEDAGTEIRYGRMTREEGIKMVLKYDSAEPSTLDFYLKWLGMTKEQFFEWIEPMRDLSIWKKLPNAKWILKDNVYEWTKRNNKEEIERAKLPLSEDTTFDPKNRQLYYSEKHPPLPWGDPRVDNKYTNFFFFL